MSYRQLNNSSSSLEDFLLKRENNLILAAVIDVSRKAHKDNFDTLDGLTFNEFTFPISYVQRKFNISRKEARDLIAKLIKIGLITNTGKTTKKRIVYQYVNNEFISNKLPTYSGAPSENPEMFEITNISESSSFKKGTIRAPFSTIQKPFVLEEVESYTQLKGHHN